jgi:hypothetical protein
LPGPRTTSVTYQRISTEIDELLNSDRTLASILEDVARRSVRLVETALEAEVESTWHGQLRWTNLKGQVSERCSVAKWLRPSPTWAYAAAADFGDPGHRRAAWSGAWLSTQGWPKQQPASSRQADWQPRGVWLLARMLSPPPVQPCGVDDFILELVCPV